MTDGTAQKSGEAATLSMIRRILVAILLLGLLGTGAELLLLNHVEDLRQWIPLALILLSLVILGWHVVERGPRSTRAIQGTMIAFIASGLAGFYLHYLGSAEFKLESNPALSGWALFWEAAQGKAPPPLAPGVMIQLGLVGLAYAYRHPALSASAKDESIDKGE